MRTRLYKRTMCAPLPSNLECQNHNSSSCDKRNNTKGRNSCREEWYFFLFLFRLFFPPVSLPLCRELVVVCHLISHEFQIRLEKSRRAWMWCDYFSRRKAGIICSSSGSSSLLYIARALLQERKRDDNGKKKKSMMRLLLEKKKKKVYCRLDERTFLFIFELLVQRGSKPSRGLNNRPVKKSSSFFSPLSLGCPFLSLSDTQSFKNFGFPSDEEKTPAELARGWLAMNSLSTLQLAIYIYG